MAAPSAGTQTVPFPAGEHAALSQRRLFLVQFEIAPGIFIRRLKKHAASTCWIFRPLHITTRLSVSFTTA